MICLVMALKAEADAIIEHFELSHKQDEKFLIFENDTIKLIISGVGKINSCIATTYMQSIYKFDRVVNLGMCGAFDKNIKIADIFEVNKIIDIATSKVYHVDKNGSTSIACYDKPLDKITSSKAKLCDMESSGFLNAAKKFFKNENITLLKVVSDHINDKILTNEQTYTLFEKNLKTIEKYL